MEIIFQEHHPKGTIRTIKIFRPTRGAGGTLAYKGKINDRICTFEMDDDGNWHPNSPDVFFNRAFIGYINTVIGVLERQRLNQQHH